MTDRTWAGFDIRDIAATVAAQVKSDPDAGAGHCDDPLDRPDIHGCRPHQGMSAAAYLRLAPGAERAPLPPRRFSEAALSPVWDAVRGSLEHLDVPRFIDAAGLLCALLATSATRLKTSHESQGGSPMGTLRESLRVFLESDLPLWPSMPEGEGGTDYAGFSTIGTDAETAVAEALGEMVLHSPEQFDRVKNRQTSCLQILRQLPAQDWRPTRWNLPAEGLPLHVSRLQPILQPVEAVAHGHLPLHEEFRSAARILMRLASTPAVELTEEPATDPETNELEQRIQAAEMLQQKGMTFAPELQQSLQADRAILQRIKSGS